MENEIIILRSKDDIDRIMLYLNNFKGKNVTIENTRAFTADSINSLEDFYSWIEKVPEYIEESKIIQTIELSQVINRFPMEILLYTVESESGIEKYVTRISKDDLIYINNKELTLYAPTSIFLNKYNKDNPKTNIQIIKFKFDGGNE